MTATQWVGYAQKAITAFVVVVLAAIAAGQVDVEPWIEVILTALVATIAVYVVPNRTP